MLPAPFLRLLPRLSVLVALLAPLMALARAGGGEHYTPRSHPSPSGGGGGGGGGDGELVGWVIWFLIRHPQIGVPVVIVVGIVWYVGQRNGGSASTRRALLQRQAEWRTQVRPEDVAGWVNKLCAVDPSFELPKVLEKVKSLFLQTQDAWFKRELTAVRPFLSDAMFQRFLTQLRLVEAQGVRDALADIQVEAVALVGLEQSDGFDTLHLRIQAQARDTDVPASTSDEQALRAARNSPLERFTEIWSFVRKPGAKTRIGDDLYQGKCPNCGAPYAGGAANQCEYCGAIVNSGNYDWTLAEITQGVEFSRHPEHVPGLPEARQRDPGLHLEVIEDRASLIFWKWIDAQSASEPARLAKLAAPEMVASLSDELSQLKVRGRQRFFLECAVGAVLVRAVELGDESEQVHVEIRWSARMGLTALGARPSAPSLPQRSVFTLRRKAGAKTQAGHGMSTHRCPQCNAPLSESLAPTCDFCGAQLSSGAMDWVLVGVRSLEAWEAARMAQPASFASGSSSAAEVVRPEERERLLYMMAALAAADGTVDARERKLLRMCSSRWSVPWANVELALNAGPQMFERLIAKGSPEADRFLGHLVELALVDGKVDRSERRMLEAAAEHLGIPERLPGLLGGR